MKIGDISRRSGLSVHTLRYYERIGLVPRTGRDRSGQRDYDASILGWLEFLGRLKTTGMPLRDMLRYAQLVSEGEASFKCRHALLERHRRRVREHLAELEACLRVLDDKIAVYAEAMERIEG